VRGLRRRAGTQRAGGVAQPVEGGADLAGVDHQGLVAARVVVHEVRDVCPAGPETRRLVWYKTGASNLLYS
jgi:hypothetical protein